MTLPASHLDIEMIIPKNHVVNSLLQRLFADDSGSATILTVVDKLKVKMIGADIDYRNVALYNGGLSDYEIHEHNAIQKDTLVTLSIGMDAAIHQMETAIANGYKPEADLSGIKGATLRRMKQFVRDAGPNGVTSDEFVALDPKNTGIRKRLSDLESKGIAFRVGEKYVHSIYKDDHPVDYAASEAKRQQMIVS